MTGWALNAGRRFEEAERPLRQALELNPRHGLALWNLAICLIGLGRPADAVEALKHSTDRDADGAGVMDGVRAWALAVSGRADESRRLIEELRERMTYRHVPRYTLGWALAALGEIESALDEYEASVAERDAFLMYPLFPGYDPLRDQPRFQRALEQLGLQWAITASAPR